MNPFRLSARLRAPQRTVAPLRASPGRDLAVPAVPVPWRVVARSDSGVIEVEHLGQTPLHSVRFALAGGGMLGLSLPRTVLPGERLRVSVRGSSADAARGSPEAMLMLRWFQPDGVEFLWPIAL